MLWLELIGTNSGAFYLDICSCEVHSRPERFAWSMSGILGDGHRESPVLIEVGEEVCITFLQDDWKGLRPSGEFSDVDPWHLETALRYALGIPSSIMEEEFSAEGASPPRSSRRSSFPGHSYHSTEYPPYPRVSEPGEDARNAA